MCPGHVSVERQAPTLWALAPLCVSDKLIWGVGAWPGAGRALAGTGCIMCLWCWEGPGWCRSFGLAAAWAVLAAGAWQGTAAQLQTARQGKAGPDLLQQGAGWHDLGDRWQALGEAACAPAAR